MPVMEWTCQWEWEYTAKGASFLLLWPLYRLPSEGVVQVEAWLLKQSQTRTKPMNLLTRKEEKLMSLRLKIKTYSQLYIFVFLNSLNLTGLFSFTFFRSTLEFKSKLLFTCIFPEKFFRNFKCLTMKQIYNHYFIVCVFIDLVENWNKGLGHGYSIECCKILVFWD